MSRACFNGDHTYRFFKGWGWRSGSTRARICHPRRSAALPSLTLKHRRRCLRRRAFFVAHNLQPPIGPTIGQANARFMNTSSLSEATGATRGTERHSLFVVQSQMLHLFSLPREGSKNVSKCYCISNTPSSVFKYIRQIRSLMRS